MQEERVHFSTPSYGYFSMEIKIQENNPCGSALRRCLVILEETCATVQQETQFMGRLWRQFKSTKLAMSRICRLALDFFLRIHLHADHGSVFHVIVLIFSSDFGSITH